MNFLTFFIMNFHLKKRILLFKLYISSNGETCVSDGAPKPRDLKIEPKKLKADPQNLCLGRGFSYRKLGKYRAASEDYSRALELNRLLISQRPHHL
jgi:tetratricopeptide (TPR) repeat protein